MGKTTIQIDDELLNILKQLKIHPRQSYNDVIKKLLEMAEK